MSALDLLAAASLLAAPFAGVLLGAAVLRFVEWIDRVLP